MDILIRYNHKSTDEHSRWRFVLDGTEIICASVRCECPTTTIKRSILSDGEVVQKWHITPIEPKSVEITDIANTIHIIVR